MQPSIVIATFSQWGLKEGQIAHLLRLLAWGQMDNGTYRALIRYAASLPGILWQLQPTKRRDTSWSQCFSTSSRQFSSLSGPMSVRRPNGPAQTRKDSRQ